MAQPLKKKDISLNKVVLKCTKVEKKVGGKKVLKDCSLTVRSGELVTIFSPSSNDRNTLAKLMCGLIPPTYGTISIRGKRAGNRTNKLVSYMPEVPFVRYEDTVGDMLTLYERFFADFKYKRAFRLIKELKISTKTKFSELSDSYVQMVEAVLVASRKASLYIFDDPFAIVDKKLREGLIRLIAACTRHGGVVVLSSVPSKILETATDRAVFMSRGEVLISLEKEKIERQYGKSITSLYRELYGNA